MENLLALLDKIQQVSPLPIFSQEMIVVQNAGMQHWLNMSLAQQRGISMNISYALPSQFLWKLVRSMASDEDVPEQSPFSREVLSWRIDELLGSAVVIQDPDFSSASQYWLGATIDEDHPADNTDADSVTIKQDNPSIFTEQQTLKRYQLACQLADLYEQYLIFRPQWINDWHQGKTSPSFAGKEQVLAVEQWQAKLWQLLTQEQSYNPLELVNKAIENIVSKKHLLPPRLSFFGINAMAPMWLSFIEAISAHLDVHFFHLNPCFDYWGDIQSEKQAINLLSKWVVGHNDITVNVGNPLLANLGQQGREFMALLNDYSTVNIDVFDAVEQSDEAENISVLHQVQQDILTLTDQRSTAKNQQDNSIVFASAHSALREVQGLHDWLLHQFNDDKTLTPKDVLVMCPQVEQYAPYVSAVFARGWQDIADKIPPLPCSIADRVSKDAEPVVAAFTQLLSLPDSRFQVSQIIGMLRLPAMQNKFSISLEELDKMSAWLEQACVHWGVDQQHKQQVLHSIDVNNAFTWQQGLSRLMRGFAFSDSPMYVDEQLYLPDVEGNDAILLGKLMLIIEQLQHFSQHLGQEKSASQWQQFLLTMLNSLFEVTDETAFNVIDQAIGALAEYCQHANYQPNISLSVVRDFLTNHFSQPDPGRQFMVGQITFCSMLPMRSIPFKVIAILGLNDGEFPRQRQPLGFDLMASSKSELGDRSRRGDDRYLFLEAIISARQSLYLSYQGRNIRNNNEKQPSVVLKELMEYLEAGYGWQLHNSEIGNEENGNGDRSSDIKQLPMQAFSEHNYFGQLKSFDPNWLKLKAAKKAQQSNALLLPLATTTDDEPQVVDINQLIRFFQHPAKAFAQQHLQLFFENRETQLDDTEPFSENFLQSYLLRQQLLALYLVGSSEDEICSAVSAAGVSGVFPDLPSTHDSLERWREDSETFSEFIQSQLTTDSLAITFINTELDVALSDNSHFTLSANFPVQADCLMFYRSSSAKGKDLFGLYLHQIIMQCWQENTASLNATHLTEEQNMLAQVKVTKGFYFDTKNQKPTQYRFSKIDNAQAQLAFIVETYLKGQQQALLLNTELIEKFFKAKAFSQNSFEKLWSDSGGMLSVVKPLGQDPYMHYFWQQCPEFSEHQSTFTKLYQPMWQAQEQIK
ncbi:exodeoxyribonuclease V subunit gamma [Colwellia hornerae]|uniref:RecBCD enzyme subunit RecC n=2 Tax=Colwellia hornerae TaxID=89402 RepID=A0A5C6Q888_9GAMM|nr:exodeoxyribonuclease V subunit gamma [Colwellia hornerae]TWX62500.1 exodeoxyribonuclease V subunit gamma [Colwellia hornerae]TWX65059.1 exodeoxyribonuclease V subunit gamma [Colwellia hornerae]